ncbi:hypothetical protein MNBD_GAMMA24-79 [hydrothermal vent metagenome]|uniref:Uncharacterized protein n=1 Tax=hydrothermal vent metagenome TaxID=652676 RepID=A0A3B1BR49_9ZZZZ
MINKKHRSKFSNLTRIIFSALLITLALSSGACSNSGSTGTATSATGTAQ